MKCEMCGNVFAREQAASACKGCPLARGCNLVRCPRCGYETVAETRLGALIRRLRKLATAGRRAHPQERSRCPETTNRDDA